MESGSNLESKPASGHETSPRSEPDMVVAAAGGAGKDEVAPPAAGLEEDATALTPPAPAASPRPYYECAFCKRGFTTAQALGGHMNIHRRDRAKPTRDSPSVITMVSRNVECYNNYRHLLGPSPPAQSTPIPIGAGGSFGMYYTSSGAAAGARLDAEGGNPNSVSPRELSLFGDANRDQDLHLGLGSHAHICDGSRPPEGPERQEYGESERELDLELRLGRHPRH